MATDQQLLDLILNTDCFRDLDPIEKGKVQKAVDGLPANTPRSNIAKAAFYLARRINPVGTTPTPPPPPPPPPPPVAPRTYNKVPFGPDARFCVAGLSKNARGLYFDVFSAYDENGLDVDGGRSSDTQVPGLKPANEMDDRGACDPYGAFPPWPAASYER